MIVPLSILLVLAAIGVAVAITAIGPTAAIAVPGVAAVIVFAAQPFVGLLAIVLPLAFEDALLLGGATLTRLLGLTLAVVWFLRKLIRRESWSRITRTGLLVVVLALVAWAMLSTVWSEYEIRAAAQFLRLGMLVAVCALVIDLVTTWNRVEWLSRVLVLGGVTGAGVTVTQYFALGVRRAGGAVAGGVNATAAILLTILPFAFFLMRRDGKVVWRLVGLAYLALAILAVTVTFSRMAFLMLPLILLAELWHTVRRGQLGLRWVLVAVAAIPVIVALAPLDEIVERVSTIGPYIDSTLEGGGGELGGEASARGYHLKVALEVFRDHPIIGVGYRNFGYHFMDYYQHEISGKEKLYLSPRSAHSSYFAILADLGLVGIMLWMGVLITAYVNIRQAWRAVGTTTDSVASHAIQAVMFSFLLQIPYGFYAIVQNEKLFWILLGLSVVVGRLALEETRPSRGTDAQQAPPGRPLLAEPIPADH